MKQHIDSFDYFVTTEIKKIVQANSLVRTPLDPSFFLEYALLLLNYLLLS